MKKILFGLGLIILFTSSALWANPKLNKSHKDEKSDDGSRINCVYCHKKVKIKKEKGQDKEALKKNAGCDLKDCHDRH